MIRIKSLKIGINIEKPEHSATGVLEGIEIFIPLKDIINVSEEIVRLEKKLSKVGKDLDIVFKKINNADFLSKAPEEVIKKEREKLKGLRDIKERLENNLKTLK
jgi:valyl-tRNA synthetase